MSDIEAFARFLAAGDEAKSCCCNTSQIEALIVLGVTVLITGLLWNYVVLAPIKLVAVFLHEFSHASATWLTCGRVSGIEVNENFGGVTYSRGGIRWVTLSAGYTGSVLWGAFFILMTFSKLGTQIAAVVFMIACVCTALILRIKDKRCFGTRCMYGMTLRVIILMVGAIPAGLWVLQEYVSMKVHPLRWCILAFGTMCTLHALFDCLHDVLWKKIDNEAQGQSDAVMFANEICGTARMWGLMWSLIALTFAGLALFGLVYLAGDC